MPIYNFLLKFLGRSIEYRCDRESAYAYGGKKMANALKLLGGRSYFSLFSTHPTTNSRIKNVEDILPQARNIRPSIFNSLANLIVILTILFICIETTNRTKIPDIYEHYMLEVYNPIKEKYDYYHYMVMQIINKAK